MIVPGKSGNIITVDINSNITSTTMGFFLSKWPKKCLIQLFKRGITIVYLKIYDK